MNDALKAMVAWEPSADRLIEMAEHHGMDYSRHATMLDFARAVWRMGRDAALSAPASSGASEAVALTTRELERKWLVMTDERAVSRAVFYAVWREAEKHFARAATPPPVLSGASDAVPDDTKVICPGCAHQFRAIPVQVQGLLLIWTKEFDGPFDTSCRNAFQFTDDGIEENDFKFCCYCGGAIEAGITGAQK